ncbi:PHA/PHB synthase family protein [Bradyrhizobium sp.]|uniref:PHA/PHB synthase family protein n=1 Tax=Bradyrhizobium sp. TaxID=376 RepID=UPI003C29C364
MTNSQDSSKPPLATSPLEAGRQWLELAAKAQKVFLDQIKPDAVPPPFMPQDVAHAFSEMVANLMRDPSKLAKAQADLWQGHAALWQDILTGRSRPEEDQPASTKDRRFKDEEWDKNLAFNTLKRNYLIGAEWLRKLVGDQKDLPRPTQKKLEFFTERFIDAVSPTNFAATNPTVLRKTFETGGANLVKGFSNLLDDIAADAGHVRRTDPNVFEVGVNLATTKGGVVLRTDMMELIQYEPSTEQVQNTPLLLVPPWVNKYYLFDLQKKTSFIKWAVDQGYTVFAISWVNPDARHAEKDFENYWLEGPYAALQAIEKITGQRSSHIVSYCLGGTLTASGLAHLTAIGEADRVKTATMIAAMTDFAEFGDFEAFVTEEQIKTLEEHLKYKGYVDSADLTRLFALLRANDLIWSSGISSYLLAEDAVASDLLYWFADGIGMPAKMLRTFMRSIILNNSLTKPGAIAIGGVPIDINDIRTPLFFVSLRDDHVAGWQDTYRGFSADPATMRAPSTRRRRKSMVTGPIPKCPLTQRTGSGTRSAMRAPGGPSGPRG